jgi:hypothetical protein
MDRCLINAFAQSLASIPAFDTVIIEDTAQLDRAVSRGVVLKGIGASLADRQIVEAPKASDGSKTHRSKSAPRLTESRNAEPY